MSHTLPFTPIEELMLHQDSRAYPYTCFIRLTFAGGLDREAFKRAAREALARQPLLAARVDAGRRRPRWKLEEDPTPEVIWREGEITEQFPTADYLDVARGGLRLLVTRGEHASDLAVQFLHACCDGLGIFQFIHDLLILYAVETCAKVQRDALPRLERSSLERRGKFGLTWRKLLKMAPKQAVGLFGVRQFLMRSPAPIVAHERESATAATPDPYPTACARHLDLAASDALRAAAKDAGVTTNDLLARDLFVALREFRLARGIAEDERWLRLMIPMSLRTAADRKLPAANVVSSVFLDRRGSDIADREQLLASVTDEMQLIKSHQLGFTFIFSLHLSRLSPGGLRRTARSDRCTNSAVFTNLGRILARGPLPRVDGELICGDVRLSNVEILAPVTPYTCAAFAACWYANRLSITLHYDPRVLSAEDARELLGLFVGEIGRTTGCYSVAAR